MTSSQQLTPTVVEISEQEIPPQQHVQAAVSGGEQNQNSQNALKPCPLGCNTKFRLETNDSTGFFYQRCGAGPVIMSNLFFANALIELAKRDIGCDAEDDDEEIECGKVYGFKPSSLIAIIATVTGVLSAFLLPFVGVIIDYTPYRYNVGACSSALLVLIQAIQIYTVESTWFPMAILQAVNGFVFQIATLSSYAYFPEIAASLPARTYQWYSCLYGIMLFSSEIVYLFLMLCVMVFITDGDAGQTGQVGQALDSIITGGCWVLAWYYFTRREPRATLEEGRSLFNTGFFQVFETAKGIYHFYPKSVGCFFVGGVFSDAGLSAFSSISVTYINEVLDFDSAQLGVLFLLVLFFSVPGSYFAYWLTERTNPITALKVQLVSWVIVNFVAFLVLTDPSKSTEAYIAGMFWGFLIGWYVPLVNLVFSMIIPSGQESELTGFFLYCSQILAWLPPLIFTLLNEADVNLKWGGIHLNIYFFIGLLLYQKMLPWEDCIRAAKTNHLRENRT